MKCKPMGQLMTAVVLATGAMLTQAAVRYDFTGFEVAVDDDPLHGTFSAAFSWVAADYVAAMTFVNADALRSCSVTASLGPATCTYVAFIVDPDPARYGISFGATLPVFGIASIPYRFEVGAFGVPGTYNVSGSPYPGTLTVTVVPEPATCALLFAGLAVVGAVARRRGTWR